MICLGGGWNQHGKQLFTAPSFPLAEGISLIKVFLLRQESLNIFGGYCLI